MSKQEELWLEELPEIIRAQPAVQFFFQMLFEQAGVYSVPPKDPELISRAAGMRDLALGVKETLDAYDATLYHELQLARVKYLRDAPKPPEEET